MPTGPQKRVWARKWRCVTNSSDTYYDFQAQRLTHVLKAFCVYTCGFIAAYLCKYPRSEPPLQHAPSWVIIAADKPHLPVCSDLLIVRDAHVIVPRILTILAESKNIWPLASRWYDHLERFYKGRGIIAEVEGGMDDSVRHPSSNTCIPLTNAPHDHR